MRRRNTYVGIDMRAKHRGKGERGDSVKSVGSCSARWKMRRSGASRVVGFCTEGCQLEECDNKYLYPIMTLLLEHSDFGVNGCEDDETCLMAIITITITIMNANPSWLGTSLGLGTRLRYLQILLLFITYSLRYF